MELFLFNSRLNIEVGDNWIYIIESLNPFNEVKTVHLDFDFDFDFIFTRIELNEWKNDFPFRIISLQYSVKSI